MTTLHRAPRAPLAMRKRILFGHLWKYRASTLAQIAAAYFSEHAQPFKSASRLLKQLTEEGLLATQTLFLRETPSIAKPTFSWRPGDQPPRSTQLAYQLEKRFSGESIPATVYYATRHAANRMGGRGGSLKRTHQLTHDLICTDVYLQLETHAPQQAADWINEDLYARFMAPGEKLGDALLVNDDGAYRMVEILGRYNAVQIDRLYQSCRARMLPFDLW